MKRIPFLLPWVMMALATGCSDTSASDTPAGTAGTTAAYYQSGGSASYSGESCTATAVDQSGVCVADAGALILTSSTVTTSGATSDSANSLDYGLNAAVLAKTGSTINLVQCTVNTSGTGATGIFATGTGSSVSLSDVTVVSTGRYALGVNATLAGTLSLANVTVTTTGDDAPAVATGRDGGTVTATGGTMSTSGADSPAISSTGAITILGASLSAAASEGARIEGTNSITLTSCDLSSSASGLRGVHLFQGGTVSGTTGTFTMTLGSLSVTDGPLFQVTNTTGAIHLKGVKVSAGSGTLVEAGATSSMGTTGSNGGNARLVAVAQALVGDLVTDDAISTITASLQEGSVLTGTIDRAALSLDSTSTWTVTGTSYLTVLTDPSGISGATITNIVGNGFNVFYDATLSGNSALGAGTFSLVGGGELSPQ